MPSTGGTAADWDEVDPFDLPEWLGVGAVTWTSSSALRSGPRVTGELTSASGDAVGCDLIAVDEAYPAPIAEDGVRSAAHHAWRRGEVHLVTLGGRLTLAVPGSAFDADLAIVAVGRLARAVGASGSSYAVCLRIGRERG